jgi:hypothetical protein
VRRHKKSKSEVAPLTIQEDMGIFKPNSDFFGHNEVESNCPLKLNSFSSDIKTKKKGLSLSRALEFFSSLTNGH